MIENNLTNWVRTDILSQPAYWVDQPDHDIKLNQNENPWDLAVDLKDKILKKLKLIDWNRYPDQSPVVLQKKLSKLFKVDAGQIVIGNGSNEVLQAIMSVALYPGDKVCVLSPTFSVYKILASNRLASIIESQLDDDFKVNVQDLKIKSQNAKITIICNPNSPTGTLFPVENILDIAKGTDGLVIVDEAYFEFSNQTALSLLEECPNLIVIRTFSKAFGLAGFRIGYGIMSADLAKEVSKGFLPFNVDSPSICVAETVLDHYDSIQSQASKIRDLRDQLINKINQVKGLKAWPSESNFFLLEINGDPHSLYKKLLSKGILVREVSGYRGCENMIRISVGSPKQNESLYEGLKNAVEL